MSDEVKIQKNYLGNKMKYVMNEYGDFLIIPKHKGHDSANMCNIKSAGFVHFYQFENEFTSSNLGAECFGESVSLKLKSDPRDSEIITRSLNSQ